MQRNFFGNLRPVLVGPLSGDLAYVDVCPG